MATYRRKSKTVLKNIKNQETIQKQLEAIQLQNEELMKKVEMLEDTIRLVLISNVMNEIPEAKE